MSLLGDIGAKTLARAATPSSPSAPSPPIEEDARQARAAAYDGGGGDLVAPLADLVLRRRTSDLGRRPLQARRLCSRQALPRVAPAVDLDFEGGVATAGCDCDVELLLLVRSEARALCRSSFSPPPVPAEVGLAACAGTWWVARDPGKPEASFGPATATPLGADLPPWRRGCGSPATHPRTDRKSVV